MVVDPQLGEGLIRVNAVNLFCTLSRLSGDQNCENAFDDGGIAIGPEIH